MKDNFDKKIQSKSVLGFDSSEEITHFNNHDTWETMKKCFPDATKINM